MQTPKRYAVTATAGAAAVGLLAMGASGPASADRPATVDAPATTAALHPGHHAPSLEGRFVALNNSGVRGWAKVTVKQRHAKVSYVARGLSPDLPHAAHLHFSHHARNQCPTVHDDANGDFRVNVAEGHPAYGMIKRSLTLRGDVSPASALAVDRFSTAPDGVVRYERRIPVGHRLAEAIRAGNVVLVVHGSDYNGNAAYDFDSAGPSELDASLPAEATDPAACTVLR